MIFADKHPRPLTSFNRLFKYFFREGSLTALLRGHQPRIPRLHAAVRGGAGAAVPRGPGRELRHGGGHQVRPRARPAVPHRQHPPVPHGLRRGDTSQCSFILDIAIGQCGSPFEDFLVTLFIFSRFAMNLCYTSALIMMWRSVSRFLINSAIYRRRTFAPKWKRKLPDGVNTNWLFPSILPQQNV